MRRVTRCAAIALSGLLALPAAGARVEGVEFAERREAGDAVLALHAVALLRYRVFLKAYVAALYLGEGVAPEQALEDVPRLLEIEYFWPIRAEDLARATTQGIARNVDPATLAGLRERIEHFNSLYQDVRPGDRYSLTYVPGAGTELALNGVPRGSVQGVDFASAMFAIWLGEAPVDESLKSRLLRRS